MVERCYTAAKKIAKSLHSSLKLPKGSSNFIATLSLILFTSTPKYNCFYKNCAS